MRVREGVKWKIMSFLESYSLFFFFSFPGGLTLLFWSSGGSY